MPLIKPQITETFAKPSSLRLEVGLKTSLDEYCAYYGYSSAHVISEAIRYVIENDKEFQRAKAEAKGPVSVTDSGNGKGRRSTSKKVLEVPA